MQFWTFLAYLVAAALFIAGIRRLRRPETARSGNTIAAVGMVIALVATIFVADIHKTLGAVEIGAGVLVGSVIGAVAAQRVQMTAMPQMVAAFNGVGGAAAALVAVSEFYRVEALGGGHETLVSAITVLLSVVIGTISFSGSVIAFIKLHDEFMCTRELGGIFDFCIAGIQTPVADVFTNCPAKEMRGLQHHTDF